MSFSPTKQAKMREKAEQQFQLLKEKLGAFGERAKSVLTGRPNGYTNLDLNQSLLDSDNNQNNEGSDGRPDDFHTGVQPGPAKQSSLKDIHIPTHPEMMLEVTHLSKEAAQLLWETIAMQAGLDDPSPEMVATTEDLVEKAQMLHSQLRGLIRNDDGTVEVLLAEAFEANDMLSSCLDEYKASKGGKYKKGHEEGVLANEQGAPASEQGLTLPPKNDLMEAPLIQLDDTMDALPSAAPSGPQGESSQSTNPFGNNNDPFQVSAQHPMQ